MPVWFVFGGVLTFVSFFGRFVVVLCASRVRACHVCASCARARKGYPIGYTVLYSVSVSVSVSGASLGCQVVTMWLPCGCHGAIAKVHENDQKPLLVGCFGVLGLLSACLPFAVEAVNLAPMLR